MRTGKHPPMRARGKVAGHVSFLDRKSNLRARTLMFSADAITGFFGALLALGGLRLQNWLV